MNVNIVVAYDAESKVIGLDDKMPWGMALKKDMKRFRKLTTNIYGRDMESLWEFGTVVMGRSTYESMGKRLLPNRMNIVLTRNKDYELDEYCNYDKNSYGMVLHSRLDALVFFGSVQQIERPDNLWIIGGEQIYKEFLPFANRVYATEVLDYKEKGAIGTERKVTFPALNEKEWHLKVGGDIIEENGARYQFVEYARNQF